MPYTKVVDKDDYEGAEDHWSCNDCGAHADKQKNIKHHPTCVPGESAHWEEFYSQEDEDEEEEPVKETRHCPKCVGFEELGIDACTGCCGRN